MNTNDYLDLAKTKSGISSDYGLAARIGATRQAVSRWRNGGNPDPLYAAKIAELAQIDPLVVIADIEIEKANTAHKPTVTAEWRTLLSRLSGVAAALMVWTVLTSPSPAHASMKTEVLSSPPVYIMSTRRRRKTSAPPAWLAPLFGLFRPI